MGQMSQKQFQRTLQWISEKCPDYSCRVCGGSDLALSDVIISLPYCTVENGTARTSFDKTTPAVQLICKGCAHWEFFSAALIGLE